MLKTPSPSQSEQENTGIGGHSLDLMRIIWRHKMTVLGVLLIGLSLANLIITIMPSLYTARSLILIETGTQNTSAQPPFADLPHFETALISSEIEVLKSRNMGRKAVERLGLLTDPAFNPRFHYGTETQAKTTTSSSFKKLSVYGSELENLPPEATAREIDTVVSGFLNALQISSVGQSHAIQIEYTAPDPKKAALIANTIADLYIEQRRDSKLQATKKLADWLDLRLKDLRKDIQTAEQAVLDYQKHHNITQNPAAEDISAEQRAQLKAQHIKAKAQLAESQARLTQIKSLARNPKTIESLSEIGKSPLIQQLKRQEIALEGRLSDLSTRYGPRHPEMIKLNSEIKKLRKTLRTEMNTIVDTVENEMKFTQARLKALEESLAKTQDTPPQNGNIMMGLRELERQVQSKQLIFETFLKTYKQTHENEKDATPQAHILSHAITPQKPSYPNKPLLLGLSAAGSLLLGLILALLLGTLNNKFQSIEQLEKSLNHPCFALIPHIKTKTREERINYITSKPGSALAESIRTLRTALNLHAHKNGKKPKVITVTSSLPGEGKTTLAVWLGRLAAKSLSEHATEKVIIIDANLRRPDIHNITGHRNDATLVEYLTDQKALNDIVQKDDASGLHIIHGRAVPNSALDLLSSQKMADLIAALKKVYDLIILDSPACLAVSDARILSHMSDQTLYAVAWNNTPRKTAAAGVKQFADMSDKDDKNLALVFTHVDMKHHAQEDTHTAYKKEHKTDE